LGWLESLRVVTDDDGVIVGHRVNLLLRSGVMATKTQQGKDKTKDKAGKGEAQPGAAPPPDTATVKVTVQPVTWCRQCDHPVTYPCEPGAAAAALTAHYNAKHPSVVAA